MWQGDEVKLKKLYGFTLINNLGRTQSAITALYWILLIIGV